MVVFGQKWLYSSNIFCIRETFLYSGKIGCIRAKVVEFEQKLLYSGSVVVFGQSGCIRVKNVVFGQKLLYWGKNNCILAN